MRTPDPPAPKPSRPLQGCGPIRPSRRAKARALALIGVHVVIAGHLAHWWIAGRTLTPVEPSEAMETLREGALNAGFVFFAASLLLTLVFGRFFCGWACHLVALQDLCAWLLKKARLRPKPVRSRVLAFVPLGAGLYMFVWPLVARALAGAPAPALHARFTTTDFWATFPGPVVAVLTFLVAGFLVVWWLGAKGFCTYGCPYGGFFAIADRFAPGRIVVDENCDGCAHCTAVCTSNVRVHEEVKHFKMVIDGGCMKCMDCVSVCPKGALSFGFRKPALAQSARRVYDFGWGEELAMALVFGAALASLYGSYGIVPFLFSLGLAVLAATAAVVLWRLLRRPVLAWQHLLLKKDGRLSRSGLLVAAACAMYLGFVAHSGVVQFATVRGHMLLDAARLEPDAGRKDGHRLASAAWLLRAEGLGLFDDHRVQRDLAQHASFGGNLREVEARMRRVVAAAPRDHIGWDRLARVIAAQGPSRLDEAEKIVVDLLARQPDFADAQRTLAAIREQRRR